MGLAGTQEILLLLPAHSAGGGSEPDTSLFGPGSEQRRGPRAGRGEFCASVLLTNSSSAPVGPENSVRVKGPGNGHTRVRRGMLLRTLRGKAAKLEADVSEESDSSLSFQLY